MKKTSLMAVALLLITPANAQLTRDKVYLNNSSDTNWQHLSVPGTRAKKANGNVKVYTTSGAYDLYAVYKNNEVSGYYAVNSKGDKFPAHLTMKEKGCYYCTPPLPEPGGKKLILCWWEPKCPPQRPVNKAISNTTH